MSNADEKIEEKKIVYQPDKKLCSICFGKLKGHEKDGFCHLCEPKK
jgi:hypothetical protein